MTSNHVASLIAALDEDNPSKYRIEWVGSEENPDKTYTVDAIQADNRPQLILEAGSNKTIDANPMGGQPKVLYHSPSDGYVREQRLVEMKLFAEEYHWRHQVQYISERLQRELDLRNPL